MRPVLPALIAWLALSTATAFSALAAGSEAIDFSLIDHEGRAFHLHDLRGKVVLVFFGYTSCPDVCPIELQHMATALRSLADDAQHARGLFITLDPENDRPEVLAQYLNYFGAGLVGLSGDRQQIDAVARQFRVTYQKNPASQNRYTLDHTANLFVIDRDGKLDTVVPFGFPPAHIENLLRELIAPGE